MLAVRIIVSIIGVAVVLAALSSSIKTVILPRTATSTVARSVFRVTRTAFDGAANLRTTFAGKDSVMGYFAPVALVALAAVWMILVTGGFTMIFWGASGESWADAFHLSGSSITTLGFAPAATTGLRALAFAEAGIGLFLVALVITYLPSMYTAFAAREQKVALLEVRAGSPPSAVELLTRYHAIGWEERLPELWLEWEEWFAALEESHTSYATLNFFRSPQPERSWVTAAGTILDSAAIWTSCVSPPETQAAGSIAIRGGYIALRRIADFFGIAYDPDPQPTDLISITRQEFDEAYEQLADAGVPLHPDRDKAWADFSGWRVNYDTVLLALAEITMAPYAPWTSDRSAPSHNKPQVSQWGNRIRDKFAGT